MSASAVGRRAVNSILRAAAAWSLAAAGAFGAETAAPRPSALPFIEDDLPRAQALARSKKLPLFVEAWAPW